MAERPRKILVCSCEDTVPLDLDAVRRGLRGAELRAARHLCRSELDSFKTAIDDETPLIVGCTQEAPLFGEVAGQSDLAFVNLRETAGWSAEAGRAAPKMAALIAAAGEIVPDHAMISFESSGVTLIYGRDEAAIEVADLLAEHLDITVLITGPDKLPPPRVATFPIVKGTVRSAKGHLGAFELTVDDYAAAAPSSRDAMQFGPARNGAVSRCDLIIDMSGNAPLFSASDLRDGYLRVDPGDPAAVLRAALKARDLVGTFDKPRYIEFTDELCAHSRSRIVGCTRCLDLCPAGAIAPAGNHVAIDPHVCAGCGQCAAVCPTGAAAYAVPPADTLMRKVRAMMTAYREAGGKDAIVLIHDDSHGAPLIDALARHGPGLPANVLPLAVNEVTQVGLETVAAAFAYGTSGVRFLLRGKPRHDTSGLHKTIALIEPILSGLGFQGTRVATIETDDPFALGDRLGAIAPLSGAGRPATFQPVGGKRDVMRLALRELHQSAPAPVDVIALPAGAPFGTVELDVEGCTLCLSCVSACPTGALSDDLERPMLRFAEDACVQCGLCKTTCPERVISLKPQIDFRAATAASLVLKQEEPFHCVSCGKPFGVRSSIERVAAKLEGKHWMYQNSAGRLDVIKMCADCRVGAMTEQSFDPYGKTPARPSARTTEDYLRERDGKPKS